MSKMLEPDKRWITVKILREQHEKIEKIVEKNSEFISTPEFLRVAISRLLKEAQK